jgi:hypothetical protein
MEAATIEGSSRMIDLTELKPPMDIIGSSPNVALFIAMLDGRESSPKALLYQFRSCPAHSKGTLIDTVRWRRDCAYQYGCAKAAQYFNRLLDLLERDRKAERISYLNTCPPTRDSSNPLTGRQFLVGTIAASILAAILAQTCHQSPDSPEIPEPQVESTNR